jgi:hypothetical protein
MYNRNQNVYKFVGLIALVAITGLWLVGCNIPTGGSGSSGIQDDGGIGEPTTGRKTITYKDAALEGAPDGSIARTTINNGITFSLNGGKMYMFFPENPSGASLVSDFKNQGAGSFLGSQTVASQVTIDPSSAESANIVAVPNFMVDNIKLARSLDEGNKGSDIIYVHVSADVTFSSNQINDVLSYNAFELALKTGWNLVQSDYTDTTVTIKIADTKIPWTVVD